MKKIKWILLSLCLLLILAACGQGENEVEDPATETSGSNVETNENEEEEEATGENDGIEEEDQENATDEETVEEVATIDSVTLFFADNQLLEMYRVESNVPVSMNEAGAMETFELWLAGPTHEELFSLLPEGVSVQTVEFKDDVAHVSFSEEIFDANLGSSGEAMLLNQIALLMQQFGFEQTKLLVDGEAVTDFLGHIVLSEPITAGNPEEYSLME